MADWRIYFAGKYLNNVEVTSDWTLTIDRVIGTDVENPDDQTVRFKQVVHWKEDVKPWVTSKTAAECMAAMFGDDDETWAGRKVTIYRDEKVKVGRDEKGGIRVRGAPGIKPITIEIKHARKKAVRIKLADTASSQAQRPPPDLDRVLTDAGLTVADLDAYLVAQNKPPVADLDTEKRAGIAVWLANPANQAKVRPTTPEE